jgi:hypothetical protein
MKLVARCKNMKPWWRERHSRQRKQGECFIKLSQCDEDRRVGFQKKQLRWFALEFAAGFTKTCERKAMIDKEMKFCRIKCTILRFLTS